MNIRTLTCGIATALLGLAPAGHAQRNQDLDARRADRGDDSRSGYVRVGIDFDNDGTYDRVERIYVLDLEDARDRTRQRSGRTGTMAAGRRDTGRVGTPGRDGQSRPFEYIRGEVANLSAVGLTDEMEHRVARVRADDGRVAKVDFGPLEQESGFEVEEGDEVSVYGVRGRINDRTVLMARRVVRDGESFDIVRTRNSSQKRLRGTVKALVQMSFDDRDGEFSVARVETVGGRNRVVILGPTAELDELDLARGDEIAAIVRPATIAGKPALTASQVSCDGEVVFVARKDDKSFEPEDGDRDDRQTRRTRTRDERMTRERDVQPATVRADRTRTDRVRTDRVQTDPEATPVREAAGTVADVRNVKFQGRTGQYVVGTVQTTDGNLYAVNFGQLRELGADTITEGAKVAVSGRMGKMNGKAALIARSVIVDGRKYMAVPTDRVRFDTVK